MPEAILNIHPIPVAGVVMKEGPTASLTIVNTPYASLVIIYINILQAVLDSNGDIDFNDEYNSRSRILVLDNLNEFEPNDADIESDILFEIDQQGNIQPKDQPGET